MPAFAGEPVAVALFAAGIRTLGRSSKYHRPRGPVLPRRSLRLLHLRIDGRPNRRACMMPARAGLACERQNAFPSADVDLLAAADWLFPRGHGPPHADDGQPRRQRHVPQDGARDGRLGHAARRPTRAATATTDEVARRLRRRRRARPAWRRRARDRRGRAGRAGRRSTTSRPRRAARCSPSAGGTARAPRRWPTRRAPPARALVSSATAIGFFPEDVGADGQPGVLAVATDAGLVRVRARRTLYATGAYDQNLPFADNDRPGVIAARACGRLAFRWGVRPVPRRRARRHPRRGADRGAAGARRSRRPASRSSASTSRARRWSAARGRQAAARRRGGARPRTASRDGRSTGDLVAVAALPAPASELPRQHGARVAFDAARGGFAAVVDERHATDVPGVFACGDVTGFAGTAAADARRRRRGTRARGHARHAGAGRGARAPRCSARGCAAPAPPPPRRAAPRRRPRRRPTRSSRRPSPAGAPATPESARRRAHGRCAGRSSTPPGGRCATSTTTRRWAASTGTPCAPSTSRSRSARRPRPPSTASLNQMIGELGQSHMMIIGPGAEDDDDAEQMRRPGEAPAPPGRAASRRWRRRRSRPDRARDRRAADHHARARRLVGRPGRPGARASSSPRSRAARSGAPRDSARPLRPVEERFAIRRAAQRRLLGAARHRACRSPTSTTAIARARRCWCAIRRARAPVQLGHLPPLYPEVRAYEIGDVGVIAFNIFLLQPMLEDVKQAMARFVAHHVARGRARPARQPGRPGRDGDPDRVAVRDRAADAGDAAVPRLRPDVHRARPRWARCRSPGRSRS